jgi:hypothetical protein
MRKRRRRLIPQKTQKIAGGTVRPESAFSKLVVCVFSPFAASTFVLLAFLGFAVRAHAQDPFEIRVEQIERPRLGVFSFELHANYVARAAAPDAGAFPAHHQFHVSPELTAGLTRHLSIGFMLMSAVVPGRGGLEYTGWRFKTHLFAPESWRMPVRLGLTAEFASQRPIVEDHARALELRPVIEHTFGRAQVDLNLSLVKPLSDLSAARPWEFEPSVRVSYALGRATPAIEYFGHTGHLTHPDPWDEQVQQLYPGVTLHLAHDVDWEFGAGIGLTGAGNRLVFKTRLEIPFGHNTD